MLVKLLPEQVVDDWKTIRRAILDTLSPIACDRDDLAVNILDSILNERMTVWSIIDRYGNNLEDFTLYGFITTTVTEETNSGSKALTIYSMAANRPIPSHIWRKDFGYLLLEAEALGCDSITAYTELSSMAKFLMRNINASISAYVSIPVSVDTVKTLKQGDFNENL